MSGSSLPESSDVNIAGKLDGKRLTGVFLHNASKEGQKDFMRNRELWPHLLNAMGKQIFNRHFFPFAVEYFRKGKSSLTSKSQKAEPEEEPEEENEGDMGNQESEAHQEVSKETTTATGATAIRIGVSETQSEIPAESKGAELKRAEALELDAGGHNVSKISLSSPSSASRTGPGWHAPGPYQPSSNMATEDSTPRSGDLGPQTAKESTSNAVFPRTSLEKRPLEGVDAAGLQPNTIRRKVDHSPDRFTTNDSLNMLDQPQNENPSNTEPVGALAENSEEKAKVDQSQPVSELNAAIPAGIPAPISPKPAEELASGSEPVFPAENPAPIDARPAQKGLSDSSDAAFPAGNPAPIDAKPAQEGLFSGSDAAFPTTNPASIGRSKAPSPATGEAPAPVEKQEGHPEINNDYGLRVKDAFLWKGRAESATAYEQLRRAIGDIPKFHIDEILPYAVKNFEIEKNTVPTPTKGDDEQAATPFHDITISLSGAEGKLLQRLRSSLGTVRLAERLAKKEPIPDSLRKKLGLKSRKGVGEKYTTEAYDVLIFDDAKGKILDFAAFREGKTSFEGKSYKYLKKRWERYTQVGEKLSIIKTELGAGFLLLLPEYLHVKYVQETPSVYFKLLAHGIKSLPHYEALRSLAKVFEPWILNYLKTCTASMEDFEGGEAGYYSAILEVVKDDQFLHRQAEDHIQQIPDLDAYIRPMIDSLPVGDEEESVICQLENQPIPMSQKDLACFLKGQKLNRNALFAALQMGLHTLLIAKDRKSRILDPHELRMAEENKDQGQGPTLELKGDEFTYMVHHFKATEHWALAVYDGPWKKFYYWDTACNVKGELKERKSSIQNSCHVGGKRPDFLYDHRDTWQQEEEAESGLGVVWNAWHLMVGEHAIGPCKDDDMRIMRYRLGMYLGKQMWIGWLRGRAQEAERRGLQEARDAFQKETTQKIAEDPKYKSKQARVDAVARRMERYDKMGGSAETV